MDTQERTHKLGLSVPLLCASLVAIFIGAPIIGLTGVWGFIVPGDIFPGYMKVLHAHAAWWSLVILLNALLISSVPLKPCFRRWVIWSSFFTIPLYVSLMIGHYALAEQIPLSLGVLGTYYISLYGILAFIIEMAFFGTTAIIALLASGSSFPAFTMPAGTHTPSRYDIISDVVIPWDVIRTYITFLMLAVFLGMLILLQFAVQNKPVSPAGMVQFHTHIGFFSIGFLMAIMVVKAIGANDVFIALMRQFGKFSLAATTVGFVIFLLFDTHSLAWVVPAFIYFAYLVLGWIALFGIFGKRQNTDLHFDFVKGSLIFLWGFLFIFILMGPYLALKYTTNSDVTITYNQPNGGEYGNHVGPYPDPKFYPGTAPNKGTPRGLENFHLSPASWAHAGIFWLLIFLVFGKRLFGDIGKPNLVFLLAITTAQAPLFNAIGRFSAWANFTSLPKFPTGPGPLFLIAHPLKALTITILIVVTLVWMWKIKKSNVTK